MYWFLKSFSKYFDFKGRARRKEFWIFHLFYFIGAIIITIIGIYLENGVYESKTEWSNILVTLYSLLFFIPSLSMSVRRIHDVNKSGIFILVPIYSFFLFLKKGDIGENEYGADPKSDAGLEIETKQKYNLKLNNEVGIEFENKKKKKQFPIIYNIMIIFAIFMLIFIIDLIIIKNTKSTLMQTNANFFINEANRTAKIIDNAIQDDFHRFKTIGVRILKNKYLTHMQKAVMLKKEAKMTDCIQILEVSTNGTMYYSDRQSTNISEKEYFKKALKGENVLTEPYIDTVLQKLIISYVVPIYDNNKKIISILKVDLDGLTLSKYIKDITIGITGFCNIIDMKGTCIAHPNKKIVSMQYNIIEESKKDSTLKSLVDFIKSAIDPKTTSGYGLYEFMNDPYMASFKKIESTDWIVTLEAPLYEFQMPLERLKVKLIMISFIVFIFMTVIVLVIRNINKQKKV